MNRASKFGLCGLVAIVGAALWWAAPGSSSATALPEFVAGTVYSYDVSLDHQVTTAIRLGDGPGQQVSVDSRLRGQLEVSVDKVTADAVFQTWRVTAVSAGEVIADEHKAADSAALASRLIGPSLVVELDRDGAVRWLHRDNQADDLFTGFVELMVAESALTRRTDSAFEVVESAHLGDAQSSYTRDGTVLRRSRSRYHQLRTLPQPIADLEQTLESSARAELGPGAMPTTFESEETLSVRGLSGGEMTKSRQVLSLRLRSATHAVASPPVRRRSRIAVGTPRLQPDLERRSLVQQRGDMTWERFASFLRSDGVGAAGSRGNEMLWQSIALLKLEPERIDDLVSALASDASFDARMFGFAALAGAGTHRAQQAMVAMLGTDWAMADMVGRRRLLQQLSFLVQPTRRTADFLSGEMREHVGERKLAAAHSLGSVARKFAEGDHGALAEKLNGELVAALGASADPVVQAGLLSALTNVGDPRNIAVITEHAASEHNAVRASVARALRRTQTDRAEKVLLGLLNDGSGRVQRAAVDTLSRYHLDDGLRERVGRAVIEGGSPSAYMDALPLVKRIADVELRRQVLGHMFATAPLDKRLRGQIRAELQRAGG